jgi:hypothetical protein
MPGYVAKRSVFVNTFLKKRSKLFSPHAGSKAADEQWQNQVPQVTNLTVFD